VDHRHDIIPFFQKNYDSSALLKSTLQLA